MLMEGDRKKYIYLEGEMEKENCNHGEWKQIMTAETWREKESEESYLRNGKEG